MHVSKLCRQRETEREKERERKSDSSNIITRILVIIILIIITIRGKILLGKTRGRKFSFHCPVTSAKYIGDREREREREELLRCKA